MPLIKSAIKKLRKDHKREKQNHAKKDTMRNAMKDAAKKPTVETIAFASSLVDKAAKRHLIHENKASRYKSSLAKLLSPKKEVKAESTPSKAKKTAKTAQVQTI